MASETDDIRASSVSEVTVVESRDTQSTGQWWEMLKGIGNKLPRDLSKKIGYEQDPTWFNNRVAELVRLDRHSDIAHRLEELLAGREIQVQHIKTNTQSAQASKGQFKSIQEQVKLFQEHFPLLDVSHLEENIAMASAWMKPGTSLFCYIRTDFLVIQFGIRNPWDNFGILTEKTLGLLEHHRSFRNHLAGQLDSKYYRLLASTKDAMQKIEAQQSGDIIVIPIQLGELYRGKSIDASRALIGKAGTQFCLPAFIVGQILLVNPDILTSNNYLFIDCPGDEYRYIPQERFDGSLFFSSGESGTLHFVFRWIRYPYSNYGSAWGVFQ